MARLRALWLDMLDSLWFVPALLTLAGAGLAIVMVNSNEILGRFDPATRWWVFGGSAEGAAGVLGAIASGIITVTGVVFSVTIVALQLASNQFTPRVLRQFTADRANQVVLGVFIGTFTYTLLVQRTLRTGDGEPEFVPNVAVTGAVLLALVSIGFLIYFINHAARSIQAAVIIDSVAIDTLKAIAEVYPERIGVEGDAPQLRADEYTGGRPDAPRAVATTKSGYIQSVDVRALAQLARQSGLLVRVDVEVGKYVLSGDHVMSAWPAGTVSVDVERVLRHALVLGIERTNHQDPKFGVIELMDIAVKAMSSSVNDPTTALNALDRLGEILLELAWRRGGDLVQLRVDGRPLLITRRPLLRDTVGIAFDQIRHYGSDNPTVAIAMVRLLARLAVLAPSGAHPIFIEHLHEVKQAAERRITDPEDRRRFDAAAAEALRTAAL